MILSMENQIRNWEYQMFGLWYSWQVVGFTELGGLVLPSCTDYLLRSDNPTPLCWHSDISLELQMRKVIFLPIMVVIWAPSRQMHLENLTLKDVQFVKSWGRYSLPSEFLQILLHLVFSLWSCLMCIASHRRNGFGLCNSITETFLYSQL